MPEALNDVIEDDTFFDELEQANLELKSIPITLTKFESSTAMLSDVFVGWVELMDQFDVKKILNNNNNNDDNDNNQNDRNDSNGNNNNDNNNDNNGNHNNNNDNNDNNDNIDNKNDDSSSDDSENENASSSSDNGMPLLEMIAQRRVELENKNNENENEDDNGSDHEIDFDALSPRLQRFKLIYDILAEKWDLIKDDLFAAATILDPKFKRSFIMHVLDRADGLKGLKSQTFALWKDDYIFNNKIVPALLEYEANQGPFAEESWSRM